jgi:periplasmic protein TonB
MLGARLTSIRIKIEFTKNDRRWHSTPSVGPRLVLAALVLSLMVHIAGWFGATKASRSVNVFHHEGVKIRDITPEEARILDSSKNEIEKAKRIIETQQTKTTPPKVATNLGAQDHATEIETRVSERKLAEAKAQDPLAQNSTKTPNRSKNRPEESKSNHAIVPRLLAEPGQAPRERQTKKTETNYEKLFPTKADDLFAANSGGFVEPLDDSIAEGDRVDMNTSSFKYISYFTGIRKQIEMVWIYPSEAVRRGLQGAVQLEMIIEQDGRVSRVRIVQSSGYTSLDENMVKTIKEASPFAPLPKAWGKERLVVTGSFHYILSYASH